MVPLRIEQPRLTCAQTIIESLKYATTGELPPNSKTGGAFIHDPRLRNEKELLAQVKLSFRSTSGVRMVATRNLQVTIKKSTRSQKTLEGSLLMLKDGEKHSISTRVAELDTIIPQYLGVSKAVFAGIDSYAWERITAWLRKKHRIGWPELRRRFCLPGTWRLAVDGQRFRGAASVPVVRYRYRGYRIPTPWTPTATTG